MNNLSAYNKPYKSPAELIEKLEQQGLCIEDKAKAESFLKSISYYRFKIYLHSFLDSV
jgi:abortive infection bacteriophage resistance protein